MSNIKPKPQCVNCRWWTGDRDVREAHPDFYKVGDCTRITNSAAQGVVEARLYPVNYGVWLATRCSFCCNYWEAMS